MTRRHRALALVAAVLLGGCGASVLPQIHDEASRIEVARRLYDKGDIAVAIEVLAPFTSGGTGGASRSADTGVYLLGLCHLRQKEWALAETDFDRLLRDYPESDSAASAKFRLGEAYAGQSRGPDFDQEFTLKGLQQWMDFRRDNPDHWLAPEAARRIAQARAKLATKLYRTGDLYVKLGDFEPAKVYFKSVLSDYSETPVYGDAIIGMAVATAGAGQRDSALVTLRGLESEYAGKPLAARAAHAIKKVERWKNGPVRIRQHRAPNEPPPPPPTPSPNPLGGNP